MASTRVLALVPYPLGRAPGQRYRIEQWAPRLAAFGVEIEFSPFLSAEALNLLYRRGHFLPKTIAVAAGWMRRASRLMRMRGVDVAYVFRELAAVASTGLQLRLARAAPIVFDFDDAIYVPAASEANSWLVHLRSERRVGAMCQRAREVMVGNATLAEFALRWTDAVSVVPSTIDTDSYVVRERPPNRVPIVGWTGSHTTRCYLEALLPALRRVREVVEFELRVVGIELPSRDDLRVTSVPWNAATEVADLQVLDVGLMPLEDDVWCRGKCGMKALQYMALGIPPVVSPIGANCDIVQDGANGLHASSEAEWVQKITLLLSNPALRRRLGSAARRSVEERYSAGVWAPIVAALLRQAATDPR